MKVETQPHDDRTLTLTVEVDDERVLPALRAAARRLAKQYRIAGFRPGKAPYETILRHLGENAVYNEALEDLGQKVYQEALDQEKIDPLAPGELADIQLKPMVLKFMVPLRPEVDLGDYHALRVPYAPPSVEDEAVQASLEQLREHQSILEPVDRPAELGDVVTLDAKGFLHEGENPSDFLLADQDVAMLLDEKADWPVPGFAPQVVGMRAEEERKFDLTFADDYANTSLRGEVAHFEVRCKEVKSRTLPEWSDDLAREIGEYESLDVLRARVRAELQQQADRGADREYADQVLNQLVEQASVQYPPLLLETELDDYLADLDRRLHEQNLTLDDYLKIGNKSKEQFREEVTPEARRRLKRSLVLSKVAELEKLEVSADEVSRQIDQLSLTWGERTQDMRQALSSERGRRLVTLDLLTDKTVQRLAQLARGGDAAAEPAPDETRAVAGPVEATTTSETAPEAAVAAALMEAASDSTAKGEMDGTKP